MSELLFRVGYRGRMMDDSFLELLGAAPGIAPTSLDVPTDEFDAALASCHAYYVSSARNETPPHLYLTQQLIDRMPSMFLAVTSGAGYDTVDVAACTAAGIAVLNQSGGNAEGVAEHTLGMILVLLKRMPEMHLAMRAGDIGERERFMGRELVGRTVGLVGLGFVGERVAELLRVFGCRVLAYDPTIDADTCAQRGATQVSLQRLLEESDVVSLHCPLSHETRGLIGARELASMREGALLINTARGGIVDEMALHAALESGHLGGAGLDAWEQEPPPVDHPLLTHSRVIGTVHTGGVTSESRARVASMAAEALIGAAAGDVPPRLLNPEVLPAYQQRWSATFDRAFPAR